MQQAQPPTDAEQVQTLRTANAQLRQRVKEQEQIAVNLRDELLHRAQIDAEDTHRLQRYAQAIICELDELRLVVTTLLLERDMLEHRLGEAHQAITTMEETQ